LSNRYIVGKLISYNGEGALYLGYDKKENRRVTIKEFMPDTLCSRNKDEEFVNVRIDRIALYKTYLAEFIELHKTIKEAKSSDPQLAVQNITDIFEEFDTAYAVFEYIEGENLKTALSDSKGNLCKIKWDSVKSLFSPVFYTINALCERGVVHRAFNPSALIINEAGNVKIVGFAISALRTYGSALKNEMYPGYSAPELYDKSARHGSWTDVYGISAVLYALLTGTVPDDAVSRAENDETVNPYLINPKVPVRASKIIMQGLALKSSLRIQTAADLAEKLWGDEEKSPKVGEALLIKKPEPHIKPKEPENVPEVKPTLQNILSEKVTVLKKFDENDFKAAVICSVIAIAVIGIIIIISYTATHGKRVYTSTAPKEPTETYAETITETQPPPTESVSLSASESAPTETETVFVVPDFSNRVYNSSFQQNYNLLKINVSYEYSSYTPKNVIFGQDIPPKSEVKSGTEITLKVSKGPAVIPLPDYTGKTLKEYLAILTNAGIKFETEETDDDTVPPDTVTGCNFKPGDPITIAIVNDDNNTGSAGSTGSTDTNGESDPVNNAQNKKIDVVTVFYAKENFRKITSIPEELEEAAEPETDTVTSRNNTSTSTANTTDSSGPSSASGTGNGFAPAAIR
jgi:serine/threonine-protein kinase